jgi:hypothetical protein
VVLSLYFYLLSFLICLFGIARLQLRSSLFGLGVTSELVTLLR